MTPANYETLFFRLLPEAALVVGALLVLAADLALARKKTHTWCLGLATAIGGTAVLAAAVAAYHQLVTVAAAGAEKSEAWLIRSDDGFAADGFGIGGKLIVLALGLLALLLIKGTSRLKNPAEHVALTLFALTGLTLMCVAQNLLVIFVALELASLTLYILAGFDKTRPESAEAGLKYFLYGGTAAAFLLFGFSLLYGLTGEIELPLLGAKLGSLPASPLSVVAAVMVLVGFGYKAAAAPFHLWAPDAYQGAPATSAALIASASKVGGLVLLARLLCWTFPSQGAQGAPWIAIILLLAAASLLLGNIAALVQSNVRRLLAYSAIAHAGVMLLAALCDGFHLRYLTGGHEGVAADLSALSSNLLYYLLTYGLATVGAFGVVAVVENNGGCQKISDLAGLWRRSRLLTVSLLVFILSLAGVPPLAGFFAKFFVFWKALALSGSGTAVFDTTATALFWLVFLAIAMSAVALYYYLQILKAAFVSPPENEKAPAPIRVPFSAGLALVLCAAALLALGIFHR
jgi:NADH-quinone oxidoreductase subunit N